MALDLNDKNLDASKTMILALDLKAAKASSSIVTINISQSKIGVEGGQAIVEALKTTTLESIVIGNDLTLQLKGELESDSFDASGQSIDPGYAMIMAWWLTTPVTASIATLVLSQNDAITGKRSRDNDGQAPWIYGEEMEGWTALCSALPDTMISMDFSGCQLQPKSLAPLNAAISKMASLKVVNLSECPLTGATWNDELNDYDGGWENIDSDMTGFIAFCGVLGKLHEINLSGCQLGPTSAAELGKAISSADGSLTKVVITGAVIGADDVAALRSAAPIGCEVVW